MNEASSHPWCRIPPLTPDLPWIPSHRGLLRPERALAYNRPELVLHGAAATRPGHSFTAAELSGFAKTASRALTILGHFDWTGALEALEWPSPEQLLFTVGDDSLLVDLANLWRLTEQAETLELLTLGDSHTAAIFRRC